MELFSKMGCHRGRTGQGHEKRWSPWSLGARGAWDPPWEMSRRQLLSRESESEVGFGSSLLTFKALQADGQGAGGKGEV